MDIRASQERLEKVAASLSLPLVPRTRIYNTRLAQELAKWAESQGKGDDFHHAAFRAYFVEGKNIAVIEELAALAASAGLPADEAERVIRQRSFRQAVDADWARARALRISAVPTFLFDHRRMVGFQPYEALVQLIE
jgi:predicted DsbA family dithiol-disulfide isomerase